MTPTSTEGQGFLATDCSMRSNLATTVDKLFKKSVDGWDGEWPREGKTLANIDTLGLQAQTLIVVFNSLGDRLKIQNFAQLHKRMHERRRLC
jgi:hypothetical protein